MMCGEVGEELRFKRDGGRKLAWTNEVLRVGSGEVI